MEITEKNRLKNINCLFCILCARRRRSSSECVAHCKNSLNVFSNAVLHFFEFFRFNNFMFSFFFFVVRTLFLTKSHHLGKRMWKMIFLLLMVFEFPLHIMFEVHFMHFLNSTPLSIK